MHEPEPSVAVGARRERSQPNAERPAVGVPQGIVAHDRVAIGSTASGSSTPPSGRSRAPRVVSARRQRAGRRAETIDLQTRAPCSCGCLRRRQCRRCTGADRFRRDKRVDGDAAVAKERGARRAVDLGEPRGRAARAGCRGLRACGRPRGASSIAERCPPRSRPERFAQNLRATVVAGLARMAGHSCDNRAAARTSGPASAATPHTGTRCVAPHQRSPRSRAPQCGRP